MKNPFVNRRASPARRFCHDTLRHPRRRMRRGAGIIACLTMMQAAVATTAAADLWTGSIRCEIQVRAEGYTHQETQTWTLTGAAPTQQGSMIVYPATWSVTAEGKHDRTNASASRRVASWTASVSGRSAPVAFVITPTGELVLQKWHAQLTAPGGYTGTDQFTQNGVTQSAQRLQATVYEWQFQKIQGQRTDTQLTGTHTSHPVAFVGPLQPHDAPVTITCAWALGVGTAPPLPPSTLPAPNTAPPAVDVAATRRPERTIAPEPTSVGVAPPPPATRAVAPEPTPTVRRERERTLPDFLPAIVEVQPNSAPQWSEDIPITFTARLTNFTARLTDIDLGPGIIRLGAHASVESPTRVIGSFRIAGDAAPGPRAVSITTGTDVVTLPNAFVVTPRPARDVFRLTPENAQQGQQDVSVSFSTFQWRYFLLGTTVDFGPGITVSSFEVQSDFAARAKLNIDLGAPPGPRAVTVRRPDGRVDVFADVFNVAAAPLPTISLGDRPVARRAGSFPAISVSPAAAARGGTNVYITITGHLTNFAQRVTTADFGPGVTVDFVDVPSPTQAKAVVQIAANALPGKRTVKVTTGNEVLTLADGFTVKAATPPAAANDQFSVRRDRRLVSGTVLVSDFTSLSANGSSIAHGFAQAAGRIFFAGQKPAGAGNGLWTSDGTPSGTTFVKAIQPQNLTPVGNRIFFTASQPGSAGALWVSDGTPNGTVMIHQLPGDASGDSAGFLNLFGLNGALYFIVGREAGGWPPAQEFWRSDGTSGGTVLLKNAITLSGYYGNPPVTEFKAAVYFIATEQHANTARSWLWKTDGTPAGTTKVREVRLASHSQMESAKPLRAAGSRLYITMHDPAATTAQGEPDLWVSDGTEQGTTRLVDINPTPATDIRGVIDMVAVNNVLFFTLLDCLPSSTRELWRSDGTPGGTVQLKAALNPNDGWAMFPTAVNGRLYFRGSQGLWTSDGTAAGTTLVKAVALPQVTWTSPAAPPLAGVGGTVFFVANDGLWKSDGSAAGTVLLNRLAAKNLTDHGGDALLFSARDLSTSQHGLWVAGPAASLGANDTLPANATLTFAMVNGPSHGSLLLRPDGGFIYQPNTGFAGTDHFTYTVSDGAETSPPATVTINVTAGP